MQIMHTNTIIIIPGPHGDEYVIEVGKNPAITPILDEATLMSDTRARGIIAKMNLPNAITQDANLYRSELSCFRQAQV
jgi:hypothetical protein